MIERKFVKEQVRGLLLEEFVSETLKNVGLSHVKMSRTPLGEKITIFASRPGLVVGRKGENIKKLTQTLKKKFELENPQIEIAEVSDPNLDARIVGERIASTIERFGIQKFKAVGHKTMTDVMHSGALGVQITISGKIPGARAKTWRFYNGYLKKSGQIAMDGVRHASTVANMKSGCIGIQVWIMPADVHRPDDIHVIMEHTAPAVVAKTEEPKKEEKKKRAPRKKAAKKQREETSHAQGSDASVEKTEESVEAAETAPVEAKEETKEETDEA
ncbi:MAG: 30S ribosomal protein S3 [Nanoarchaeota archaeon]